MTSNCDIKLRPNATTLAKLLALLQRNGDVAFQDIYIELGGDPARRDEVDARGRYYAQSWISTYIRKLNRRLKGHGQQIIPGRLRRTYCLASVRED